MDYGASVLPNPSSIHGVGVEAKRKLEKNRKDVADILSCSPKEIIFTSGGTESNNLAIQGVIFGGWTPKMHIVTTNIEHPSVLETIKLLKKRKLADITIIDVEQDGLVDPKKILDAIKKNTILVSVMYANNEIGTIQPIKEIAKGIRFYRKNNNTKFPLFHTDGVQAVNYLDINLERLGVDLLSISGTKIESAGRVGVLYKKRTVNLAPIWGGGDQEMGLRPGTENLLEIVKFSSAFQKMEKEKEKEKNRLYKLQNYFLSRLSKNIKNNWILNGDKENRLPNNINITFANIPSDLMVLELSARGIMTSPQSACHSSHRDGSYVIKAIHKDIDGEVGGVRFSFGKSTKKEDIDYTIKTIKDILKKLKKWYPVVDFGNN